jgi:hypothetical protein
LGIDIGFLFRFASVLVWLRFWFHFLDLVFIAFRFPFQFSFNFGFDFGFRLRFRFRFWFGFSFHFGFNFGFLGFGCGFRFGFLSLYLVSVSLQFQFQFRFLFQFRFWFFFLRYSFYYYWLFLSHFLGDDDKFTIQARDRFGNNLTKGGAAIAGALNAPSGQAAPVVAHDNGDGTYTCTYPGLKESGQHSLQPTLNGEVTSAPFEFVFFFFFFFFMKRSESLSDSQGVKDSPFSVHVRPGDADDSNFEWLVDGADRTLVAGVPDKFQIQSKVRIVNTSH